MGFVAAICTQCGASIEVDESKEAGICSHCGTAFITEKVINNYHIHNTTNVTNKIEHATINVKKGDDASDIFKRYGAFIKQRKYGSTVKLLDKALNKFPDSGIVHYCVADFLMTVKGYDSWLHEIDNGSADEVLDNGEKALEVGTFFGDFAVFDMKKFSAALDAFEAKSDDEICSKIKNTKYRCTITKSFLSGLVYYEPEVETLDICEVPEDKRPAFYDYGRFETMADYWKAVDDWHNDFEYWGQYSSALFCAKKTVELAEDFLTDFEREQYADFIKVVNEKCDEFERVVIRREEARKRVYALQDRILKENKRRIGKNADVSRRRLIKFITTVVVLGVIAIAVVIIVKKFF